jgi:hypothetical protein
MSDLKDQIDVDIRRFLDNIESQSSLDKLTTLRQLFDKHLHLHTCDFLMGPHDLRNIISNAKSLFSTERVPIYLGDKKAKVNQNELPNLFMIEATIRYLAKNDCLKKIPRFDKQEDRLKD